MFNRKKIEFLRNSNEIISENFNKLLKINEELKKELEELKKEKTNTEEEILKKEIERKKSLIKLRAENEQLDRQEELEKEFRGLMNYSIKDAIGKGEQK